MQTEGGAGWRPAGLTHPTGNRKQQKGSVTQAMTKAISLPTLGICATVLLAAGCNSTHGNSNSAYEAAINNHYKDAPVCIWQESKKMPAQAATSDDSKTEGYDALTQAGLLTRTTAEKKKFIIASEQVNNYDLSSQGRSSWTPDSAQPGYGNFCYGTRSVTSIDSTSPGTTGQGAPTEVVNYHYKIGGVPGWAQSAEMKTAFPAIGSVANGQQTAQATLVKNGDAWGFAQQTQQ
jgi:hypothetical protein